MKFFALLAVFAAVLSLACAQIPPTTVPVPSTSLSSSPTTTTTYTYTTSPTTPTTTLTTAITTPKPFKQQLLSLLFNKRTG
ncbi:C-type lectin domain-containing protein 141 [Drosophila guanche]|uniref:C-type lectin domain-containing protein 141 n=1 Tax=Drosophila guanche TaxID=7266 RepID=UPI00147232F3|nr:C-type lectin domain-containing protein 141 [Drosophila guanche]